MLLIGVLLVALVCLALGLILAQAGWLIASLVASVVAGVVLWRSRNTIGERTPSRTAQQEDTVARDTDKHAQSETSPNAQSAGTAAQPGEVWVVDGRPDYHREGCASLGANAEPVPHDQAVEDGFTPCADCDPAAARPAAEPAAAPAEEPAPASAAGVALSAGDQVWVVDGQPDYHVSGCERLPDGAEAIPFEQAAGDGFTPCPSCVAQDAPAHDTAPQAEPAGAPADTEPAAAATAGRRSGEVFVVDGQPHFHLRDCAELVGQDAEAVPHEQAVEDGFQPCPSCTPDRARGMEQPGTPPEQAAPELQREPEPQREPEQAPVAAAGPGQSAGAVWVVDGQLHFHVQDCVELVGQKSEAIPHEQAVEDAFQPCPTCTPDRVAGETAHAEQEPAGVPDQRPEPEPAAQSVQSSQAPEAGPEPEPEPEPAAHAEHAPAAAVQPEPEPVAAAAGSGAHSAAAEQSAGDEVWVVNGRPRFHLADCLIIKGQDAAPMPYAQATEDGYRPCAICEPDAVRSH